MKVVLVNYGRNNWHARVVQGVQSFDLSPAGTREEARWVKEMFEKAILNFKAGILRPTRKN